MKKLSLVLPLLLCYSLLLAQFRQGQDHALFFAVNEYERMTDLSNPIQNAKDIAAELERRYGFETEVVPNPDLETIERKIAAYKRQYASGRYAKEGQLLIFFTGHGIEKGPNGYFMPADANPDRPHVSAVEYGYWRDEINAIDCKHILVAIDACHSITFDPNWKNKPDRNFNRPGERFSDQVLLNHKSYRARLFFTSDAEGNQTPDRSTFAEQFLAGLRTHRSTARYLTSSELFASYMKKAAPTPGGGSFGNNDAGSAFLFFQRGSNTGVKTARSDQAAWRSAQQTHSITAYQQYLAQYPIGDFVPLARQNLQQLQNEEQELLDWQATKRTNTALAYRSFMQKYPQSIYQDVAAIRLQELAPTPKTELDKMVLVQGGTFQMGSKDGGSNETPHSVTLGDYYIGRHEVTVADFSEFVTATNYKTSAERGDGSNIWTGSMWKHRAGINWRFDATGGIRKREDHSHPVLFISWHDAIEYCNWRSKEDDLEKAYTIKKKKVIVNWKANGYRLPTEAEWEYAARSRGKDHKWAGTSSENQLIAFANGSGEKDGYENTSPVGSFKANDLGLFDMSGNVDEWCWDSFYNDYYGEGPNYNPTSSNTDNFQVLRGGAWSSEPTYLRCAYRNTIGSGGHRSDIGFRLSRAGG